ncbi:MAG: FecR family protein, partial [Alphaproteobacteria bacterium]
RRAVAAALAACLLLAVFAFPGGPLWTGAQQSGVYETGRGERSTVHLSDGTLATLTTDSVLIEEFTPEMRRVRLVKGQVYFDVMSDAGRPFVVEAGDGTVMALGTQFDMCRKTGRVVVTLIEGAIEVASRETQHTEEKSVTLKTGEQVSYDAGKLSEVQEVDVASVSSWRNGMIRAEEGDSFASFVERFNRHSGYKVLIDGQDPRFREIPIDGTFSVDNPEAVAATLKDADYLKKRGLMAHTVKDSAGNLRVNLYSRSFRSED